MKCKFEPCDNEVPPSSNGRRLFCNERCTRKQAVTDKRHRNKKKMVDYLGGSCQRCGYVGHDAAMVPHHVKPSEKEFSLGQGNIKAWARLEEELKKCVLLCQNCHATVHATKDPEWIK
jgi:5-methylcytosine-specific restriction endonuclease McrA